MPRSNLAMFLEHLLTLDDQGVIQELTKLVRAKQPDWAAIAYDPGYNSQGHFIADFKQVLGKTPLQYKKDLTVS